MARDLVFPSRLVALGLAVTQVALVAPLFARATEIPRPDAADPRIKWAAYDPLEVYRLVGAFRSALEVVFAGDETIVHVALGDQVAWEVAPEKNLLFLKPREPHPPTNLIVTTERATPSGSETRTYTFELQIRGGGISERTPQTYFEVRFRYPDDEAAAKRALELQGVQKRAADLERAVVDLKLSHAVLEGTRNFNYRVQGSSALQPSEISDNGLFTVMRFPGTFAVPAFFQVTPDGSESLVPFDVRGEFIVLHTTAKEFRLRRGSEVLCVYNEALAKGSDPYGSNPGTGTASPIVERTNAPSPQSSGGRP